jgi:hypothetical protein
MVLLTTCTDHSKLHFTDHWHTETSVLKSITVLTSCFLATNLTKWRFFSFLGHAVARWLTLHPWTHSAIFSASLAEPNSRLTAYLEIRNSTNYSESYVTTDGQSASVLEYSTLLGLTTRFLLLSDSYGFVDWGALSHDWASLVFARVAVIMIINEMYVPGLLSGQAQYSRSCCGHFSPWEWRNILTATILDSYNRAPLNSAIKCRTTVTTALNIMSRVKLFTSVAPTDLPVTCCSCWGKGAGTRQNILNWTLLYKHFTWTE